MTKPKRRAGRPKGDCKVCLHPDRYRIEMDLVAGVSNAAVGRKYGVSKDSCWRHVQNHLPSERRAALVAGPLRLSELADKANAENVALVDYIALVRAALLSRFLAANEADDRQGTGLLAGRLTEVLRLQAQVTGELSNATAGITNNTLILNSPFVADLQSMLLRTLAPHPEARAAVIQGLEELSRRAIPDGPPLIGQVIEQVSSHGA